MEPDIFGNSSRLRLDAMPAGNHMNPGLQLLTARRCCCLMRRLSGYRADLIRLKLWSLEALYNDIPE